MADGSDSELDDEMDVSELLLTLLPYIFGIHSQIPYNPIGNFRTIYTVCPVSDVRFIFYDIIVYALHSSIISSNFVACSVDSYVINPNWLIYWIYCENYWGDKSIAKCYKLGSWDFGKFYDEHDHPTILHFPLPLVYFLIVEAYHYHNIQNSMNPWPY